MVKLTTGSTITVTVSLITVSFSLQVTFAVLFHVPFMSVTAVIVNAYDSPTFSWSIMILLSTYEESLHAVTWNCSGTMSSIVTTVALDGPLLVTLIVNTMVSPTCT